MINNRSRQGEDRRFLGFYWDEIKRFLNPATPILVTAVYSFVLIFPRYHRNLFRFEFMGAQTLFAEKMAVTGLWFLLVPVVFILLIRMLSLFKTPGSILRDKLDGNLEGLIQKALGAGNATYYLAVCATFIFRKVFLPLAAGFSQTPKYFRPYRLRDYGFRPGKLVGWRDAVIFFAVMMPFVLFAIFQKDFSRTYPLFKMARNSLGIFLIWEGVHLLHMFGWEFLNRGFLLFGLEKSMGRWAILASAIPFALLHIGKPELEAYGSFLAAIALGWLAYRSRSFLPGVFLHWGVALTVDVLSIVRSGGFG